MPLSSGSSAAYSLPRVGLPQRKVRGPAVGLKVGATSRWAAWSVRRLTGGDHGRNSRPEAKTSSPMDRAHRRGQTGNAAEIIAARLPTGRICEAVLADVGSRSTSSRTKCSAASNFWTLRTPGRMAPNRPHRTSQGRRTWLIVECGPLRSGPRGVNRLRSIAARPL